MRTQRFCSVLAALALGFAAVFASTPAHAATLQPVPSFGSNPGGLAMNVYVPDSVDPNPAVVVALHGCAQDATAYHAHSGWQKYADAWGFIVVYPQQSTLNNANRCFNWFEAGDQGRGGEAASIVSMIDYSVSTWNADAGSVFVSGLSAGGAMSAILLSAYPERFAGGSIVAGIPYKCATSMITAFTCMNPGVDKTAAAWGDLVRSAAPGYNGPRGKVAIWHGAADYVVATRNSVESVEQWTNVLGAPGTPTQTVDIGNGTTMESYGDDVRRYLVAGMGHGTPVDPGSGADQCGTAGAYFLDTICSTYHDAVYFGLDA